MRERDRRYFFMHLSSQLAAFCHRTPYPPLRGELVDGGGEREGGRRRRGSVFDSWSSRWCVCMCSNSKRKKKKRPTICYCFATFILLGLISALHLNNSNYKRKWKEGKTPLLCRRFACSLLAHTLSYFFLSLFFLPSLPFKPQRIRDPSIFLVVVLQQIRPSFHLVVRPLPQPPKKRRLSRSAFFNLFLIGMGGTPVVMV